MNEKNEKAQKPVQVLRDRLGGISEELKNFTGEQRKIIKKISETIKDSPKTVPEISEAASLPADEVLWYVMALKKYGKAAEVAERDGYYEYTLKEEKR